MMNRLLFFALALLSIRAVAQDTHFSQFYMAPMGLNPAMAGSMNDLRVNLNYRTQWQSVSSPFKTFAGSFDSRLGAKRNASGYWATGVNFNTDVAGDGKLTTTTGSGVLAYHIKVSDYSTFGGGALIGFGQRRLESGQFQSGNQYDGSSYNAALPLGEPTGLPSFSYLDMGAGVQWTYSNTSKNVLVTSNNELKAHVGLAVFHLNSPAHSYYETDEKLYPKLVLNAGALFTVPNSNLGFVPGLIFQKQGPASELVVGSLVRYKLRNESKVTGIYKGTALSIGAFFRAKDAVALSGLLEVGHYAMGLSYDLNTSDLNTASGGRGAFEISLRYVTPNPFNGSSPRFR